MSLSLLSFLRSESGSTTADWIVLTSAAVGMSLNVMVLARTGAIDLSLDIQSAFQRPSLLEEDEGPSPMGTAFETFQQNTRITACSGTGECVHPSYWRVSIEMSDGSYWRLQRFRGGGTLNGEFNQDLWFNPNGNVVTEIPPDIVAFANRNDPLTSPTRDR